MGSAARAIPFGHFFIRPLACLIYMAKVAGIGGPVLDAQIRPGDPKAVVRPVINDHVIPTRHVTLDTLGARTHVEEDLAVG